MNLTFVYFRTCAFLLFAIGLISICSCGKDEIEHPAPIDWGYGYYPLATGKYRVFQVDSILFDTIAGAVRIDSIRTYLLEETTDTFRSISGKTVYRIQRYEKKSPGENWVFKDVASAERDSMQGIRTEDNFRLLKLVFPLKTRQVWNSTLYIDNTVEITAGKKEIVLFKNWESEVTSIGKSAVVLGKTFKDVLELFQANDENSIELRRVREKYAKGIGLISCEMEILDTQRPAAVPWRKKTQSGFILKQYLIDYN
jgi:hypothetical protein